MNKVNEEDKDYEADMKKEYYALLLDMSIWDVYDNMRFLELDAYYMDISRYKQVYGPSYLTTEETHISTLNMSSVTIFLMHNDYFNIVIIPCND